LSAEILAIPHGPLQSFTHNGNTITGVATSSLGAQQSEVWHASIAAHSETPLHTHAAEEIVIVVKGSLEAQFKDSSQQCSAPCTIILPAHSEHRLKNIGDEPTSHYLIMPLKSTIVDENKQEMTLVWRN